MASFRRPKVLKKVLPITWHDRAMIWSEVAHARGRRRIRHVKGLA